MQRSAINSTKTFQRSKGFGFVRALPGGACYWDKTLNALRDGYEIQELNERGETEEEAFAALVEAVEGNDIPVVVQIREGDSPYHAIVVVGIFGGERDEIIVCMNPDPEEEGKFDRLSKSRFLQMWERTDFTAFYFEM